MLKHLLVLILTLGLGFSTVSCTSSDSEKESASADSEMVDAIDTAAEESGESFQEGDDPFAEDFGSEGEVAGDLGSSDLAPEAGNAGGDEFAFDESGSDPFAEGADDFSFDDGNDDFGFDEGGASGDTAAQPPMEETFANEDPAFAEPMEAAPQDAMVADEAFAEPMAEMSEPLAMEDSTGMMDESFQESPERTWVPIKKIADQPFNKNGVLVNAVYIARPGDTIESISQKIYGTNRVEDLYQANPAFRTSSLDTGEKVYYNSPNRPNDDTMLKTFYEDMGLAPETYISQDGDNIRTVSKNLLGDPSSWKEVWATNPGVESKGELVAGTQLRYWASGDVAVAAPPVMAKAPTPPMQEEMPDIEDPESSLPPSPDNDLPPPPTGVGSMANNDIPPPSAIGESMEEPPAPPIPPSAASVEPPPPPPPPPSMAQKRAKQASPNTQSALGSAEQQEQIMMIAIGAALVFVALIMFIIIRKKKARRQIDFNTATQTQIE